MNATIKLRSDKIQMMCSPIIEEGESRDKVRREFAAELKSKYGDRVAMPSTDPQPGVQFAELKQDGVPMRQSITFDVVKGRYILRYDALVWTEHAEVE
jgi:hypothetical protein